MPANTSGTPGRIGTTVPASPARIRIAARTNSSVCAAMSALFVLFGFGIPMERAHVVGFQQRMEQTRRHFHLRGAIDIRRNLIWRKHEREPDRFRIESVD